MSDKRFNQLINHPSPGEENQRIIPLTSTKKTSLDPKLLALLSTSPVPKTGDFSTFNSNHLRFASEVYTYFINRFKEELKENPQDNIDDILDDLIEAKRQLNESLFQYIFEVSLLHNQMKLPPDHPVHKLLLPDIMDRLPFQYLTVQQIQRITSPDPSGKNSIDEKNFHDTGTPVDPENNLAWYREDPWWNSHHWHWHVIYPVAGVFNPVTQRMETKDRQGELFYYMHQQMLARYDAERMGVGLARVVPFKDFREIMHGYDPHLVGTSGKVTYGPRPHGAIMPTIRPFMQYDMIEQEVRRQRIFDAIDFGYFQYDQTTKSGDGTEQVTRKYKKIDIDLLGATVEANAASIEGISNENTFYGSLHNLGHRLIAAAADPKDSMNWPKGVMSDVATAIRDPMFWRWHKFIDDTITRWINKQPQNPFATGVVLPGDDTITVESVSVQSSGGPELPKRLPGHLYTTMQNYPINFLHVSPVNDQNYNVTATIKRVNYEPFNYSFHVKNTGEAKDVMVRVWIAPLLREVGSSGLDRRLFIEMDRFEYHLAQGQSTIYRSSELSSVLQSSRLQDAELFDPDHKTVPGDREDFCYCGLPRHMLLPRGKKGTIGYKFKLFVMISDAKHDRIEGTRDTCGSVYCGLRDKKYPVKREMGYPFNRLLSKDPNQSDEPALLDIVKKNPNMHLSDILIHWVGSKQINIIRSLKDANLRRPVPEPGKDYFIIKKQTDKGLEPKGSASSSSTPINLNTIVGTKNSQRWRFTKVGEGIFNITVKQANLNLDIYGSQTHAGALVIQYNPHTGDNQRFKLLRTDKYHYHILAKHSDKSVTVANDSTEEGAAIVQGETNSLQSWKLVLAPLNTLPVSVAPMTKSYVVSGEPVYENIIWGHPRIHIPIQKQEADSGGAVSCVVLLRNTENSKQMRIYGVNHWAWQGNGLYIWAVYAAENYSVGILDKVKQIAYANAKIEVIVK